MTRISLARPLAAIGVGALVLLGAGCQAPAPSPTGGQGALYGTVELVPREGARPVRQREGSSYGYGSSGSLKNKGVEPVVYGTPDFAVVVYEGAPASAAPVEVGIVGGLVDGPRFEPRQSCIGEGGALVVVNRDSKAHVFSCPAAKVLKRLGPGERLEVAGKAKGELRYALADAPSAEGVTLVAGGRFVVTTDGSWQLPDLPPGQGVLLAWHERMPPARQTVDVQPGVARELALELRVENVRGQGGN